MSIFCSKLKEEIKTLRLSNQRLSEKISVLTDRSPLLYTIHFKDGNSINVVADDYRFWDSPRGHSQFILKDRTVASFRNIKGFTTKEIDENLCSNQ